MSELDIRPIAGFGAEVHGLDADSIDEGVADAAAEGARRPPGARHAGPLAVAAGLARHRLASSARSTPCRTSIRSIRTCPRSSASTAIYQVKADRLAHRRDLHRAAAGHRAAPHGRLSRRTAATRCSSTATPSTTRCRRRMQDFLTTGLTCIHDDARGDKNTEHPVVRSHPDTGRPGAVRQQAVLPSHPAAVSPREPDAVARLSVPLAGAGAVLGPVALVARRRRHVGRAGHAAHHGERHGGAS